jgi:hypothetical protein
MTTPKLCISKCKIFFSTISSRKIHSHTCQNIYSNLGIQTCGSRSGYPLQRSTKGGHHRRLYDKRSGGGYDLNLLIIGLFGWRGAPTRILVLTALKQRQLQDRDLEDRLMNGWRSKLSKVYGGFFRRRLFVSTIMLMMPVGVVTLPRAPLWSTFYNIPTFRNAILLAICFAILFSIYPTCIWAIQVWVILIDMVLILLNPNHMILKVVNHSVKPLEYILKTFSEGSSIEFSLCIWIK